MKRFLLLVLISFPLMVSAQDQPAVVPTDSIVVSWKLEHPAWDKWDYLDSVWMADVYWNTLKKHKIKMDCGHCTRVFMRIDMKIDSSGKLEQYRVDESFICDEKMQSTLENDFMEFFKNLIFPTELRNRVIRAQLGTGLKC